ncbi:hypothetical protein AHAS_Ahas04G0190800 [Arachis hypogaea]
MYALSNPWEEFLLVAGASTGKHLGLFYFNEDDAQALLRQFPRSTIACVMAPKLSPLHSTALEPSRRRGSTVKTWRSRLGVVFVEAEEAEVLAGGSSDNQQELLPWVAECIHGEVVEEQKINREVVDGGNSNRVSSSSWPKSRQIELGRKKTRVETRRRKLRRKKSREKTD